MIWIYDDGGRVDAGYQGATRDCVTRSIAIATGLPYQEVYDALNEHATRERPRGGRTRSSARTGVRKATYRRYLDGLGWRWTPTMRIGSGCHVHLRADELPDGILIASLSRHLCAVVDGVIRDTHDPSRDGTRCVYGVWQPPDAPEWEPVLDVLACGCPDSYTRDHGVHQPGCYLAPDPRHYATM